MTAIEQDAHTRFLVAATEVALHLDGLVEAFAEVANDARLDSTPGAYTTRTVALVASLEGLAAKLGCENLERLAMAADAEAGESRRAE